MIDGPPRGVALTVDLFADLVDVPAPVMEATHSAHALSANFG